MRRRDGNVRFGPEADIVLRSAYYLICRREQGCWHRNPERPRGFEADDQLKFDGLLNGQFAWFRTLQNEINVRCCTSILIDVVNPIRNQTTVIDKKSVGYTAGKR